ncbi:unnamed protein product, partial [Mycena citricolor]
PIFRVYLPMPRCQVVSNSTSRIPFSKLPLWVNLRAHANNGQERKVFESESVVAISELLATVAGQQQRSGSRRCVLVFCQVLPRVKNVLDSRERER